MTVAAGLHFMNHQGPRFQLKIFSPTSWSKLTANLHFFCVPYALNCLCEINYKMWRPQSESGCLGVVCGCGVWVWESVCVCVCVCVCVVCVCVCVWQHCRPSFINGCPLKPHQRLRVCGSIKSAHSAHNIFHHVNFCFVWHCCCNFHLEISLACCLHRVLGFFLPLPQQWQNSQ